MAGLSFPDIVTSQRPEKPAFGGIVIAVMLSMVLWAAIAALVWLLS